MEDIIITIFSMITCFFAGIFFQTARVQELRKENKKLKQLLYMATERR